MDFKYLKYKWSILKVYLKDTWNFTVAFLLIRKSWDDQFAGKVVEWGILRNGVILVMGGGDHSGMEGSLYAFTDYASQRLISHSPRQSFLTIYSPKKKGGRKLLPCYFFLLLLKKRKIHITHLCMLNGVYACILSWAHWRCPERACYYCNSWNKSQTLQTNQKIFTGHWHWYYSQTEIKS